MAVKITRQMIEAAVKNYKHEKIHQLILSSEMKSNVLENAAVHIGEGIKASEIIALMDTSLTHNGKKGILLTESHIYFSKDFYKFNENKTKCVDFSDFVTVTKGVSGNSNENILTFKFENNRKIGVYCSIYCSDIFSFFGHLIKQRNLEAKNTAANNAETAPVTAAKTAAAPAKAPAVSSAPEVKPQAVKSEPVPKEASIPNDYRDYFSSLKNPKTYYPLLYRPVKIANVIYIPTYRWVENENGTPFYIYNLINIFDGSESTLGIIEENGKLVTSHAVERKLPGYSLIDPDDKESLYGIGIIDHVYNYCNTAYMALGIYLKDGKFHDLQTSQTHELIGFEKVKNTIKENDFVFACCHGGKYYLIETRKASIAQNAHYDNASYNWRFKENGVEKAVAYSPIIFRKTAENGKITTKISLPEAGCSYQLYYLADFKGALVDAPMVFEEIKTEIKKETASIKPAPVKPEAVKPAPIKTEPKKAVKEEPYVPTKYVYQKQEKGTYYVDIPPMWQVIEMLGDYYIVYYIMSGYKGQTIEYRLVDLNGRKSTLFVKREKDDVPYRDRHMHHLITSYYKAGYKSSTMGPVTSYTKDGIGFSFRLCGSEYMLCYYLGDYKCVDLRTNTRLDFKSTPSISKQLESCKPDSFVALCKYNGKFHFIMSTPSKVERYLKRSGFNIDNYQTYYLSGNDIIAARPVDNFYYKTYTLNFHGVLPIDNVSVFKEISCEYLYGVIKVINNNSTSYCTFYDILSKKTYKIDNRISNDEIKTYSNPIYIVKAVNDKNDDAGIVRLEKFIKTKTLNLNFAYKDGSHGVFMDNDTYETYEIDAKFIPDNVKEGDNVICRFAASDSFNDYVPDGKIYYLEKA